jgi:hypothetical protein
VVALKALAQGEESPSSTGQGAPQHGVGMTPRKVPQKGKPPCERGVGISQGKDEKVR